MNPPTLRLPAPTSTDGQTRAKEVLFEADDRLAPPGTVLTRKYEGTNVRVKVQSGGFEYAGEVYGSLKAVAKAVTGNHCNGFNFFRLNTKGGAA